MAGELLLAIACQQRAGYSLSPDQIEDIKLAAVEAIAENSQPMPRCRRCGANAAYEAALYAARAAAIIHSYIAEQNPAAARQVIERIRATAELLREFPKLGHQGCWPERVKLWLLACHT